MWGGQISFDTPLLFAVGFLVTFLLGGVTGVMLAAAPIDFHVTDSYFVVAHMHYVLFGGSVFALFAGIYFWFPKVTGVLLDERLGKVHFWLTFVGFHLTFFVQHVLGLEGMPRRVADYSAIGRVHDAQPGLVGRCLPARRVDAAVPLERVAVAAASGERRRATTRGRRTRSSGPPRRRRRRTTSTGRCRRSAPTARCSTSDHPGFDKAGHG